MKKIFIILFALLFLAVVLYFAFFRGREQRSIEVESPKPYDFIQHPFFFSGSARGGWFFEAVFPVHVEDANGVVLGRGQAVATGDWMTDELVPFSGTIELDALTTDTGTVIFEKDNPSGLPENGGRLEVPVRFYDIGAKTPSSR